MKKAKKKASKRKSSTTKPKPKPKPTHPSVANAPKITELAGFKVEGHEGTVYPTIEAATFVAARLAVINIITNFQSYESFDEDGLISHLEKCDLDREIFIRFLEMMGTRTIDTTRL